MRQSPGVATPTGVVVTVGGVAEIRPLCIEEGWEVKKLSTRSWGLLTVKESGRCIDVTDMAASEAQNVPTPSRV